MMKIEEIAALKKDWDGDGSEPFDSDTLQTARIMERLFTLDTPEAIPSPDGTIIFAWKVGNKMYEIEVDSGSIELFTPLVRE